MEGDIVFPEIFFSSLEESEAMVQFFDTQFSNFKQFQDINSSFWSYEQAAAFYNSSLSDPNSIYEPIMNCAMGEEILADSFFQIDSSYQFDSLIRQDEPNSDEFTESSSVIEQPLEKKRKFQSDEDSGSYKRKVQNRVKNSRRRKKRAGEEEKNVSLSTSSCGEEDDDSNDSRASTVIELNGKRRSGRAAADSQSLYAKKRRERINERLRVLQNLVPNGTKVDISTMLEEAAQYVKFLQLQIKLLSSDELWMYAPLAYNGMNIGIDLMNP